MVAVYIISHVARLQLHTSASADSNIPGALISMICKRPPLGNTLQG